MSKPKYTKNREYVQRGAYLTEAQVKRICLAWRGRKPDLTIQALSERYGMSRSAVAHIVKGRTWQHISLPLLYNISAPK